MKNLSIHKATLFLIPIILGGIVSIYSDIFRITISRFIDTMLTMNTFVYIAIVFSNVSFFAVGVLTYRRFARKVKYQRKSLLIDALDPSFQIPSGDSVIGRELRYIEKYCSSKKDVVLLFHGLGLDADDYIPYMLATEVHSVALTLLGFNKEDRDNPRYKPITLSTHIKLVIHFISYIHQKYPTKRISLIGFSLGADLILMLSQFIKIIDDLDINFIVLLDCNINRSTMNISNAIANLDDQSPIEGYKAIVNRSDNMIEYINFMEYIHKISKKDLLHIKKHAKDFIDYWGQEKDYSQFISGLNRLIQLTSKVKCIFSAHYEDEFNIVYNTILERNINAKVIESIPKDHFQLMDPEYLNGLVRDLI